MLYQSSKGAVEISTMPLSYAKNALNKLLRTEPERDAEIEALDKHVRALSADAEAANLAPPADNPRAVIGGNNPPPDESAPQIEGRKAIDTHVADLLDEVRGCCLVIETEEQADVVAKLHRDLQKAVKLVDTTAANEKKPHNDAIDEIAAWQNGFTAKGLKKTPDGSLTKALLATNNLSSAWLRKQDEDRRAREQAAADAARAAAQEAIAARAEAIDSSDLDVIERADDALAEAESLIKAAKGVAKEKVQAGGGDGVRALALRSFWSAEITDSRAALLHYIGTHRDQFDALVQQLADADARNEATRRAIPGVKFNEERRAA